MNDDVAEAPPPDQVEKPRLLDALEGLPDDELRAVASKARELLAAREKQRRAEALREIQQLARAHGLTVEVKEPKRRRGRPPKAKPDG